MKLKMYTTQIQYDMEESISEEEEKEENHFNIDQKCKDQKINVVLTADFVVSIF